jgi:3-methyl-2-oxobutanoate hydroxymethyltransferase
MASLSETSPVTVPSLVEAKGRERISMLALYDAPSALAADAAGIDVLLVGDSVEMAVYGRPNTLSATMDTMVRHTRAVSDAARRALVVGDMPFLSYQADPRDAVLHAGRFLAEGGCGAVKLEGGVRSLPAVEAIVAADIPVMGHIGLTPQSYRKLGGFKVQGRAAAAARAIAEDARALARAGCFAVVLECVPAALSAEITRELPVPTIGIGAGAACDGQVLVFHDVLGLTQNLSPRFVRRYAELGRAMEEAARAFRADVVGGTFPSEAESFTTGAAPALRRVSFAGSKTQ